MIVRPVRAAALVGAALASLGGAALAAEAPAVKAIDWSFEGIFGTYDRAALRRGLQVYRQVCATCHSLNLLAYRNLEALGFSEDEVKAIAAEYTVLDGPNEQGEMFERPARPSDRFVPPFANEQLARLANNGALPPDLSVINKARKGGADYVYGVLTGYADPPEGFELQPGMFYNTAFPGHQIAMPPPLVAGGVEYEDGTPPSLEQQASDIVTFLEWAGEPAMEHRKKLGLRVMLFLGLFTAMLYAVKRKIWSDLH